MTDAKCENDNEEELTYELYRTWRHKLHEMADQSWDELSRQIVYLSSGALALSITFVGFFLQKGGTALKDDHFLLWSWMCLGAAITASLLELGLTIISSHKAIRDLDDEYEGRDVHSCGCCNVITIGVFVFSILAFLCGIALMLLFAWANIGVGHAG